MGLQLFFKPRRSRARQQREAVVHAAADALNALDYDAFATLVTRDLSVQHPEAVTTRGVSAFIERDMPMRSDEARPRIVIDEMAHHDNEILITGNLVSHDPTIGGPTMWRIAFSNGLIDTIEVTRVQNNRMALRPKHAPARR